MGEGLNELLNVAPSFESHLGFASIIFQLATGFLLSLIIQYHFFRLGTTVSNRNELRVVIPFVCLTTILVISVVKSSLALSLGLVGALSIVRFRTPIKEPEELVYLFLAIATGLGIGASQIEGTVAAIIVILLAMWGFKAKLKISSAKSVFLNIDIKNGGVDEEADLSFINETVSSGLGEIDLVRFGCVLDDYQAVYRVEVVDPLVLPRIIGTLKQRFSDLSVNFVEAPKNPGL